MSEPGSYVLAISWEICAQALTIWEAAKGGGGGNVSCDFGGGKRTIECALQNRVLEGTESKFGLCPFPLKENEIA